MTEVDTKEVAAAAAAESEKKEDEKMEETAAADPEVVQSVAERLKFFFSDANVRQDLFIRKFLMPANSEENKDCSVPIETLLRFNTIKQYTTKPQVIVQAVKEHLSERLVLKDDDKAIARVKPFTKELVNENIPLSLYVSNLPVKEEEGKNGHKNVMYDVKMEDIRKLFETYGEVAMVKLRFKRSAKSDDDDHTDDIKMDAEGGAKKPRRKYPLQCCMVEFDNLEAHGKAAADTLTIKDGEKVEPKRKLKVGEKTLEVKLLKEYVDDIKKKKGKKREREGQEEAADEEDEKLKEFKIEWKPGCVLSVKGLPEECDREAIMAAVAAGLELTTDEVKEKKVYADYSRGQKDGAIRFEDAELASKMMEKLKSGDTKICDKEVKDVSIMEGDAEKKYWDDFTEFKKKQLRHRNEERKNKHGNKRRRSGPKKYETMQS